MNLILNIVHSSYESDSVHKLTVQRIPPGSDMLPCALGTNVTQINKQIRLKKQKPLWRDIICYHFSCYPIHYFKNHNLFERHWNQCTNLWGVQPFVEPICCLALTTGTTEVGWQHPFAYSNQTYIWGNSCFQKKRPWQLHYTDGMQISWAIRCILNALPSPKPSQPLSVLSGQPVSLPISCIDQDFMHLSQSDTIDATPLKPGHLAHTDGTSYQLHK